MFATPLNNLKGIKPESNWAAHFKTALAPFENISAETVDEALEKRLNMWVQGSAGLAADMSYEAAERYCIRQIQLWQIYALIEAQGLGSEVSRTIFNRAKIVLEETPDAAKPTDLSFLEGENLIRKTLEHLRQLAVFYPQALRAASGFESAANALPPSSDFQALTLIEADADPNRAETMLQRFLAHNENIRGILLGADADDSADILDNCLFDPGAGITPGQGLWVKSHSLLRASISTWLGAVIPHEYDQVRCVFMSPLGKPAGLLTKTDELSFTSVSLKIVEAAQADDDSDNPPG